MSIAGLSGTELIAWVDYTSARWLSLVTSHPEALRLPCDVRETRNAGELLQHIVAVELRYAERLAGLPETPYQDIPVGPAEAIYAVHDKAMAYIHGLSEHDDSWWHTSIEFTTRSAGTMSAPRQVILVHLLMHSIRHYAQLATLVRQYGIACDWSMDYLGMFMKKPSQPGMPAR